MSLEFALGPASPCSGLPQYPTNSCRRNPFPRLCGLGLLLMFAALDPGVRTGAVAALQLAGAKVVAPPTLTGPERKAVAMLVEEVARRTQVRWETLDKWPTNSDGAPVIAVGPRTALHEFAGPHAESLANEVGAGAGAPEGFRIRVRTGPGRNAVLLLGNDARGVMFAVGHLLRHLQLRRGEVVLSEAGDVTTAPRYALRGHQLGYRPKTHSYDAWDLATWEQYYRDLIVFGANAVELVPPRTDDDADSPHFPQAPLAMMAGMSKLADDYGLDVWIWYPAMDDDYANPATVEFALREWGNVFQRLSRIDAVFVPGGDPGHTRPRHLLALLRKQTEVLHRTHPRAQMWVSPQSFNQEWLDEFLGILRDERPDWLSGVVFGPQVRISLPELRAAVPREYPIRHYPDITHSRQCQYPVPDWDVAFALTEGRECINPRPLDQVAIIRLLQPDTIGFLTYSEGCNDDVNKAIWSALGWDPDLPVTDVLREYSRFFIGDELADGYAQGLLALERNWRGPLAANEQVEITLQQFQDMERDATPAQRLNWRFQQGLFRAYYDAYTRRRLRHEQAVEENAMDVLRTAGAMGSAAALAEADAILSRGVLEPVAPSLRARIFELGEALFQSIRMQLSVERHQAIAVERGACLDSVDAPLNNRRWLQDQFQHIRALPTEPARRVAIDRILHWTDPGPGGFYDNLGQASGQSHVVRGLPFAEDPASLRSAKVGFVAGGPGESVAGRPANAWRMSWMDHAESLVDQPLRLRYQGLDRQRRYRVRVVYGGDSPARRIRLMANETIEIHPFLEKPVPCRPLEFDLPAEATRTGELHLSWTREPGLGGNGRGCQVSEIWLIPGPDSGKQQRNGRRALGP